MQCFGVGLSYDHRVTHQEDLLVTFWPSWAVRHCCSCWGVLRSCTHRNWSHCHEKLSWIKDENKTNICKDILPLLNLGHPVTAYTMVKRRIWCLWYYWQCCEQTEPSMGCNNQHVHPWMDHGHERNYVEFSTSYFVLLTCASLNITFSVTLKSWPIKNQSLSSFLWAIIQWIVMVPSHNLNLTGGDPK